MLEENLEQKDHQKLLVEKQVVQKLESQMVLQIKKYQQIFLKKKQKKFKN